MSQQFGPTIDLHTETMYLLWCPIIDVLIIMATFSSSRLAIYVHVIGAFMLSVFSIMVNLPILATSGLVDDPDTHNHMLMGLTCLTLVVVQVILGVLSKIVNIFPTNSQVVINFHRAHKILGICLVISAKITVMYFLLQHDRRVMIMILEVILISFYLYRQFLRSKMQEFNRSNLLSSKQDRCIRKVGSLQEIETKDKSALVIFQNYIFELQPLRQWHPAGYQIIQSVKNSEIDKFIYGMESAYSFPMISPQSHSKLALNLLDYPIAKLEIQSCYQNLFQSMQVTIKDLRLITKKGQIYQMYLQSKHSDFQFIFNRYTYIKQLGRHYSLTLNQSITRLYTNVNFLHFDNIQFLSKHLISREVKEYFQDRLNYPTEIPILFRHYNNGKMTSALVNRTNQKLQLSSEKGEGMQLDTISPGKIILLVGGTGIYPISDLIDHLYKLKLLQQNPFLQKEICQLNPLLLSNYFSKFRFKIMAAFNCIEEIHPVTFQQVSFLSKQSNNVEIILRIQQDWSYKNVNRIRTVNDRFQTLLVNDLQDPQLSKIFVCGPQRMNQQLHKFLKQKISSDKYMIM